MVACATDEKGNFINILDGNCYIQGQIPLKEGIDSYLTLFGTGIRQRHVDFTEKPTLIVNQIADADTHRGSLERCMELCEQVNTTVINHPEKVLRTTRERVSELLQGIPGVSMPKTVRFKPESPEDVFESAESEKIDFPFIVRMAGDHGGVSMTLVHSAEDYKALHVYPFDGRDFYLTQYVDCRDSEGLHHRQRLVIIDGEPVLRGSLYDKDWMVHGASRSFMLTRETWAEDDLRSSKLEKEVIPSMSQVIGEITRRMDLELFGIDCSLGPDGEMVIFEANANMDLLSNQHPQMNARMDMIKSRIYALLTRYSGEQVI